VSSPVIRPGVFLLWREQKIFDFHQSSIHSCCPLRHCGSIGNGNDTSNTGIRVAISLSSSLVFPAINNSDVNGIDSI